MNLTVEFIKAVVRHGISIFGGGLVSRGLIEQSDLETLTGGAVVLVSVGWSMYRKWSRAKTEEVK